MDNMTTLASVPAARPVRLELNNSGAWKALATFDAGDDDMADKARAAGQLLGELGGQRTSLRICTAEALPVVLLRWTAERGWFAPAQQWER
jgi:hypothetical protein